jgi:hypothetical protein
MKRWPNTFQRMHTAFPLRYIVSMCWYLPKDHCFLCRDVTENFVLVFQVYSLQSKVFPRHRQTLYLRESLMY